MITKKLGKKQMTELKATPVVTNKFWIVEKNGEKIATIQNTDDGIVWVDATHREKYTTIKMLQNRHNIEFVKPNKIKISTSNEVNGFPTVGKPYNALYDVSKRLPIYTKNAKSKSYYCAGYYLVKLNHNWTKTYNPKLITLQRYDFQGPWRTADEQEQAARKCYGL
jgi:hypothetical protein